MFGRDSKSCTWDIFKNLVLKKFGHKLSPKADRLESSYELSARASPDEFATGFIELSFISHNKALAISKGRNSKAISFI